MASPGSDRKKKGNLTSWFALKRPKTTSKKQTKKKKLLFGSNFFFLGLDGNRFRLADLGEVDPLRKPIRQELVPGRGLEVCCAAMVQRLLPRANVHEPCMLVGPSTRGQTCVGAPRTGYPTVYHPRGQQGQERSWCQEYRIFFLGVFFSNLQREHTRSVRLYISSTKSSSAILTPDS